MPSAGTLTRDSVGKALTFGIAAQDIVKYLQLHAHPQVASRFPVVPETVSDQVRLWEADIFRVRETSATMYTVVEGKAFYEMCVAEAQRLDALLHDNPNKNVFIARRTSHEPLREFMKGLKAKMGML